MALGFPESWRAHEAIARAYLALEDPAEAIVSLRRLLEIRPPAPLGARHPQGARENEIGKESGAPRMRDARNIITS